MTERSLDVQTQAALEAAIDACGLDLVLGSLVNICAEKAGHIADNWQDTTTAKAWLAAMETLDIAATHSTVRAVSP